MCYMCILFHLWRTWYFTFDEKKQVFNHSSQDATKAEKTGEKACLLHRQDSYKKTHGSKAKGHLTLYQKSTKKSKG